MLTVKSSTRGVVHALSLASCFIALPTTPSCYITHTALLTMLKILLLIKKYSNYAFNSLYKTCVLALT